MSFAEIFEMRCQGATLNWRSLNTGDPVDRRSHVLLIIIIFLLSIVLSCSPALSHFFVYDRSRILSGEIWRLFSGHLVHFSTSHLLLNLGGFAVLWMLLHQFKALPSISKLLFSAALIGLGLLLFAPAITSYGGLSGLVTMVAVLLIFELVRTRHRAVAIFLFSLLVAKIVRDFVQPDAQFIQFSTTTHTAPFAHLLGVIAAGFIGSRPSARRQHSIASPAGVI